MYEIWSLGHKPFEGYTRFDSNCAIQKLKAQNHIGLIHQTMTVPTQNNSIPGMVLEHSTEIMI